MDVLLGIVAFAAFVAAQVAAVVALSVPVDDVPSTPAGATPLGDAARFALAEAIVRHGG